MAELERLTRHFPEFARQGVKRNRKAINDAVSTVEHYAEASRSRGVMSAARKKIGDAQRKRWAKVKAAKK
jgi:hypothetical protein